MTAVDTAAGDDPVEGTGRSFAPRRALPNGRAVIGALLVASSAIGTFAVATHDAESGAEYVVLVDDIAPGEAVTAADVRLETIDLAPRLSANALRSLEGVVGATALEYLRSGTVLDVRDVRAASSADGAVVAAAHEVTIPVEPDRAPSVLRRGDRVALLAYSSADQTLHTAIEDALVLAFEAESAGIGATGGSRLTIALDAAAEVTSVVRWSYHPLTVILTTSAVDDVYPAQVTPPTTAIAAPESGPAPESASAVPAP